MMKTKILHPMIFMATFAFNLIFVNAQVLLHPYNLDFEDSSPNSMPYGWIVPGYALALNYSATATTDNPANGKYCLELRNENKLEEGAYGSTMQTINVKQYRGKRFSFRAAVRTQFTEANSSAHIWAKVIKPNRQEGFFEWMQDNPIRTKDWTFYEISGIVDSDAVEMNYGLLLMGKGIAWIDMASLEFYMNQLPNYEAPKTISLRAIQNLKALFNIYGHIRYFYAGNESQYNDWEKFLLNSIPIIENSSSIEELIQILNNIFKPVAPAVKINNISNYTVINNEPIPKEAIPNISLCWRHDGIPEESSNPYLFSGIVNVFNTQNWSEGAVTQLLNANTYKGKRIKFVCMAKAELLSPNSKGEIWLRFDKEGDKTIRIQTNNNPIKENVWQEYSIEADVPTDASFIRIGLILQGDGNVWFDNAKLFIVHPNMKLEENNLNNSGFEQGNIGNLAFGWKLAPTSKKAYYNAIITDSIFFAGTKSLQISSDPENIIKLPEVGEILNEKISDSIVLSMPLTIWTDSIGTLPKPVNNKNQYKNLIPDDFIMSAKDRKSRLAVVAILWNLIKHFSFTASDDKSLDSALEIAIQNAAIDSNYEDFSSTLKELLKISNDNQSKIWYSKKEVLFRLPFLWEQIGNKIIISKIANANLDIKVGDEVVEIGKVPINDTLKQISNTIIGPNENYKNSKSLEELRSGEFNSEVILKFKNKEGVLYERKVERTIAPDELLKKQFPAVLEIKDDIYYVDLTKIDDKVFKEHLKELISAKGIIFDLRGTTTISDHFLGFFIKKQLDSVKTMIPVFTKPNKKLISSKIIRSFITPKVLPSNPTTIFLMDEYSSANSETLLNIIKEYQLSEIIGRESSGNCGEILSFKLGADFYASFTTIFPLNKNNKIIFNNPIQPNIRVERTIEDVYTGRDEILETAFKYIIDSIK